MPTTSPAPAPDSPSSPSHPGAPDRRAPVEGLADALRSRTSRMVGVLLLLWLFLALHPDTRDAFLTAGNFSNLTAQISEIVIIAVGMTLVIITGGIDLSVGAGTALCGVVAAKLQIDHQQPALIAILCALLCGAALGLWHGLLVSRLRVPPFIATLSGFLAYRGLALVVSDARGLAPMGKDFAVLGQKLSIFPSLAAIATGLVLGLAVLFSGERRRRAQALPATPSALLSAYAAAALCVAAFAAFIYQDGMPAPVLIAVLAVALGAVLLRRTRLGRYALAVGGNAEAARLSGVPVARVTVYVYLLIGVLTGLAGVVAAARTNGVTPGNAGTLRELHVISAVVIGGTSLTGGAGTMVGTVVGALVFGTLSNGMNLMNVNSNWQLVLTGMILLAASILDSISSQKRQA